MVLAVILENNIASLFIIILIIIDYSKKFHTENFRRLVFLQIPVYAAVSMAFGLAAGFRESPGFIMRVLLVLKEFFQVLSVFHIMVFLDYQIHKNRKQSGRLVLLSWLITGVCFLPLFYITRYLSDIKLIFIFIPVIIFIIDIIVSDKSFIKQHLFSLLIFWGAICAGILLNMMFRADNLIWPCLCAAVLYAYFSIVRTESKLDALTGVGNRYAFNEFIERIIEGKDSGRYTIAILDVDNFNKINDSFGHREGDNALRDMASIITGCIRHTDFAARYGGDEFIIAVPVEYYMENVFDRIRNSMEAQNSKNIRPYKLEMSYGYDVFIPGKYKSIDEFLSHVDSLMYKQKDLNHGDKRE